MEMRRTDGLSDLWLWPVKLKVNTVIRKDKSGSKERDLYNIVLEVCLNACIPALKRQGESVTSVDL